MDKQRLTWLLEQHVSDKATEQERQELLNIVKANADEELFKQVLAEMMQNETSAGPVQGEPWQKMVHDIVNIDKGYSKKPAKVFAIYRWAAAAAILLLLSAGVYFYVNRTRTTSLAASQKNIPAFRVVSTARSKQYEVVLPDGSHVRLNAASSIRFPASFTGNERSVELSGEAWFDVQHADKIPFVIHSGNITTTVMGTAFDIKAYPGEQSVIVAVQRGKVKVQTLNKLLATLEKGQEVKVMANAVSYQSAIDTGSIAGWKNGNLYYKDEALANVMADLQRVFNDSIQIKQASLKEVKVTAAFKKDVGLRKALDMICRFTDARLTENNGIFILE